jgi:hypothetical protein
MLAFLQSLNRLLDQPDHEQQRSPSHATAQSGAEKGRYVQETAAVMAASAMIAELSPPPAGASAAATCPPGE